MARKNNKANFRKRHQQALKDFEEMEKKKEEKRQRKLAKAQDKTFKEKAEERKTEMGGRLPVKYTAPVVGSKIKQDKLAEQFKQMRLDRNYLRNRHDAEMEAESDEEAPEQDEEMKEVKRKNRKRGKAYKKMVKAAIKKAAKAPILVRKRMDLG